jgi:hypothetical protein
MEHLWVCLCKRNTNWLDLDNYLAGQFSLIKELKTAAKALNWNKKHARNEFL